jgi:hypothetical protein
MITEGAVGAAAGLERSTIKKAMLLKVGKESHAPPAAVEPAVA